jgi:hypothetical protein
LSDRAGMTDDAAAEILAVGDVKGLDAVRGALEDVPGGADGGEPLVE